LSSNKATNAITMAVISKDFDIFVGVRHESVPSQILFIIVAYEVTREIRNGVPWKLMFASDLSLTEESELKVEEVFQR